MDMHNLMSKLVTYGTFGLVRDKGRKRSESPLASTPPPNHPNASYNSCWPLNGAKGADTVNRAEARRTGNLDQITSLQALRYNYRRAHSSQYNNNNNPQDSSHLPAFYSPDVIIRHTSGSLSDDFILAEGLIRTVLMA